MAFRPGGIGAQQPIILTYDAGTLQGSVGVKADGTLWLRRGATEVAASILSLLGGIYYYIEFKHIIDDVAGLLEVRVDGAVWATFSGDTQATANATANQIQLSGTPPAGGGDGNGNWDDLYVLDGVDQSIADPNSPPNNDYWGNTQIQCLVPTAPGNYAEWTTLVGAPTHWQAEDEVPPDEDTSYVESATLDQRDTYNFANLAVVSATIPGIQILTRARTTLAGVANIARLYRRAGVDNQGADVVLQTSYNYQREIMGGDPIAAGVWTVANVNAMEMGGVVR